MISIGKKKATFIAESGKYKTLTPERLAALQINVEELCVPNFSIFKDALRVTLGREIGDAELALKKDTFKAEVNNKVFPGKDSEAIKKAVNWVVEHFCNPQDNLWQQRATDGL